MNKKVIGGLLVLGGMSISFANSGNLTVNDLHSYCHSRYILDKADCDAYILGMRDGVIIGNLFQFTRPISEITMRRVFMQFSDKYPASGDEDAYIIMQYALLSSGAMAPNTQNIPPKK